MRKIFLLVLMIISVNSAVLAQNNEKPKKWEAFEFLIGKWEGNGIGKFGDSKVIREYDYFMGGTYLIGKNQSIYEKQEKNPKGEIHDNWDIYSYDKTRAKYVIRQFHAENITNTYSLDSTEATKGVYEFESESIENFRAGWRAKEVYKIIGKDEFVEIFYLAAPDKEYTEYVRTTFKRIK